MNDSFLQKPTNLELAAASFMNNKNLSRDNQHRTTLTA